MLPSIKTILCATDLDAGAPYVLRYALSLARCYQARIAVLHAVEPLSAFGQSLVEQYLSHAEAERIHRDGQQAILAGLQERLDALCRRELGDVCCCSELLNGVSIEEGSPAQVILEQAEKLDAGLLVMGSHRHTVIGDALLGSTTSKVLHSATIPVLVVRIPEGYREQG